MIRVLVTGIGVVSAIGLNVKENIESLRSKQSGIEKNTLFQSNLDVPIGQAKLSNNQLKSLLNLSHKKAISRTALLGMLAAQEALFDAKATPSGKNIGFISSTSVGGMDLSEKFYNSYRVDNLKGNLHDVVMHDCGASTRAIASYLGIKGFSTTISTACSSASNAIMLGARLIKQGVLDTVLVGGTDSICKFTMNGFNSLQILDKEWCRPFDNSRSGLNLGEGAGYLVLQSEKCITKQPYCELSGYSNTNEAFHQTGSSPDGDGALDAMNIALKVAKISPSAIDYINVHGTGTPTNDYSEGRAIERLFGKDIPPFSSVKSYIGHTLGASEGIEAVYSVLSVYKGLMYPNLNFINPIEGLNVIPQLDWIEGAEINHVLSNSFGFGGSNSSLIFSSLN